MPAGFWTALDDFDLAHACVVAPVRNSYPLADGVTVFPSKHCRSC
jgi:hypothetical protein